MSRRCRISPNLIWRHILRHLNDIKYNAENSCQAFFIFLCVVGASSYKTTIIDLGEVVISHPFFSLLNFLYRMKKHHGLSEEDDLYRRIKDACFKSYKPCFTSDKDFQDALATANLVNIIYYLVDQDRFISACGADNLIGYGHRKLRDLLTTFMATCKNNT